LPRWGQERKGIVILRGAERIPHVGLPILFRIVRQVQRRQSAAGLLLDVVAQVAAHLLRLTHEPFLQSPRVAFDRLRPQAADFRRLHAGVAQRFAASQVGVNQRTIGPGLGTLFTQPMHAADGRIHLLHIIVVGEECRIFDELPIARPILGQKLGHAPIDFGNSRLR
jgi:hypothetical protein